MLRLSLTGAPVAWVNGAVAVVLSDMDFLLNGRGDARAGLGEPAREDAGRRSPRCAIAGLVAATRSRDRGDRAGCCVAKHNKFPFIDSRYQCWRHDDSCHFTLPTDMPTGAPTRLARAACGPLASRLSRGPTLSVSFVY
jgi:hypothetical protein